MDFPFSDMNNMFILYTNNKFLSRVGEAIYA